MAELPNKVLVIGATGSIGRHVVDEALKSGIATRALVRSKAKAASLPSEAETVLGDLTDLESVIAAVDGVDAVVFTQGDSDAEAVDYGGVRNVLTALNGRKVRIALMTSIGVTNRDGYYTSDWKRRSERLVRASGNEYTVVRPGWFDYNKADELQLVFRQGDTHLSGTPKDGVISRPQIAQVLVSSLSSDAADHKTLELIAEKGPAQQDLDPLFSALATDTTIDGAKDSDNMPVESEPETIQNELNAVRA